MLLITQFQLTLKLTGNFIGYIKFKRQLSLSQKMLNFDKESIQVVKSNNTTGAIKVNGTLTIVGLADEFFKILLTFIYLLFSSVVYADNHDAEQNIVEKAKEINQKIKKDQALKANNNQNAGKEEPLPLNDPFVGDGSLGGTGGVLLF